MAGSRYINDGWTEEKVEGEGGGEGEGTISVGGVEWGGLIDQLIGGIYHRY